MLRVRIDRLIAEGDAASLTADLASSKRTYTKEEQKFLLRCRDVYKRQGRALTKTFIHKPFVGTPFGFMI